MSKLDELVTNIWNALCDLLIRAGMAIEVTDCNGLKRTETD